MTGHRQARLKVIKGLPFDDLMDALEKNPDGSHIWTNLSDNGRDIVDPQRHEAVLERDRREAHHPLKYMSPQDAINRRVGFVVMDYG